MVTTALPPETHGMFFVVKRPREAPWLYDTPWEGAALTVCILAWRLVCETCRRWPPRMASPRRVARKPLMSKTLDSQACETMRKADTGDICCFSPRDRGVLSVISLLYRTPSAWTLRVHGTASSMRERVDSPIHGQEQNVFANCVGYFRRPEQQT